MKSFAEPKRFGLHRFRQRGRASFVVARIADKVNIVAVAGEVVQAEIVLKIGVTAIAARYQFADVFVEDHSRC